MKKTFDFLVTTDDLGVEHYQKIEQAMFKDILADESLQDHLLEVCGSDPTDIDKPSTDRIYDYIGACINESLNKAWSQMRVEVKL